MESAGRGRVAVVTGAGGGLGRVFTRALAAEGWAVAALGRTPATLAETIADCSPALAVQCDITDADAVDRAFAHVVEALGGLHLLVNNAGIPGPVGEIHSVDPADFRATVETNVTGTWLCTRAAFRHMAANGGGRIINNGSIAGHAPRPQAAAYAASKAAVASLSVSTALDGRAHNISVTELDIGNARTDLLGAFTSAEPMFDAEHAAAVLVHLAGLPLDVTVDQLTLTATGMPYLGRG
ncbi:SDR family oxidoreductase [Corynebacterium heidelbergense]|nr:SDR family NAD(P)-dependent oxidoreductase [Corynebacterium heidelbergense]